MKEEKLQPNDNVIIQNLSKSFPVNSKVRKDKNELKILDNISLTVSKGEFITIFGPNGCGKTTLLNLISGLYKPDKGSVTVFGYAPAQMRIGYILQNYHESLFPWLKNIDNICFPLELQRVSEETRKKKAQDLLRYLELDLPLNSYPYQSSGGQKQLVSLVRALLFEPDLLLMDEPFNALDYQTRNSMQDIIMDIWQKTKLTIIFVSHDIEEAVYLSSRIVMLSNKPATIHTEILNRLPRPRNQAVFSDPLFLSLRSQVMDNFQKVVK